MPKDTEGKNFERPYGYTWLFKIYGELSSWNDPDAKKLAANLEPLNKQLIEKYIVYLKRLPYPIRVGTHPSSALTMNFALDSTDLAPNPALKAAINETTIRSPKTKTAPPPTNPATATSSLPASPKPCS